MSLQLQASVIISYYRNLPNLSIILDALNNQEGDYGFEVIVAEDDEDAAMQHFISERRSQDKFPILHVNQADKGFRKCKILNEAIRISTTDFLVFIDGDCIPHPRFIGEYVEEKKTGKVLYGRRVMLSEKLSLKLLKAKNPASLNFMEILLSASKRKEEGLFFPALSKLKKEKQQHRLLGCNMGIFKKDLEAINGFDEDYEFPGGGEDSDIEWRLEALGNVGFLQMKFKAIVYHLYHKERFTGEMEKQRFNFMNEKIKAGLFFCKNGLRKLN